MKPDIEVSPPNSAYPNTIYCGGRIFELHPRNRKANKPPEIEIRLKSTQQLLHVSNSIPWAIEFIQNYMQAPK
jgi:hypothetical protein